MQAGCANGRIVCRTGDDDPWRHAAEGELPDDVVALLDGAPAEMPVGPAPAPAGLPFTPRSLRGVMISESHYIAGARTMIRRFMPRPVTALARGYEAVARRTFPPLKPAPRFYEAPAFYFGNHLTVRADGEEVVFPAGSEFLDFELELAAIVTRAWDAVADGPPAAADVIGAFAVVNDLSARDLQWRDERRGVFGGVVKAKSFGSAMSANVVTADALLERWDRVEGRVLVNDELWCAGSTAGGRFDLDAVVAEIAAGERLVPGEIISLGTLAGCCGLELDRFLAPGDTVRLELDGVGTVTSVVRAG